MLFSRAEQYLELNCNLACSAEAAFFNIFVRCDAKWLFLYSRHTFANHKQLYCDISKYHQFKRLSVCDRRVCAPDNNSSWVVCQLAWNRIIR